MTHARRVDGNKYNTRKVTEDGITFDSVAEWNRYMKLKLLEQYCQIEGLEVHKVFELQPSFSKGMLETIRAIKYEADFFYKEGILTVVEDVKGVQTPEFKIKWKMMKYKYPEYTYRITK
jgi:hypothetical protein